MPSLLEPSSSWWADRGEYPGSQTTRSCFPTGGLGILGGSSTRITQAIPPSRWPGNHSPLSQGPRYFSDFAAKDRVGYWCNSPRTPWAAVGWTHRKIQNPKSEIPTLLRPTAGNPLQSTRPPLRAAKSEIRNPKSEIPTSPRPTAGNHAQATRQPPRADN